MAILESGVNRRGVSQSGALAAMLVAVLVWPLVAARPAQAAQEQAPIRVGGDIKPPVKTKDVRPEYPEAAIAEGRQGIAIIEATVGPDGIVTDTKVIRSIGEDLDNAAVVAVSQWEFTPTLLNGVPVPVIMTVTVNFMLDADGKPVASPPPPPPPTPDAPPAADAPPPPPPAETLPAGDEPIRVGSQIKPPTKLKDVTPRYPQEVREAGIQGVVILEVKIDKDGHVSETKVLRDIPGLSEPAQDAVSQWEFEPTLLNGVPVAVIMTVTVNFSIK